MTAEQRYDRQFADRTWALCMDGREMTKQFEQALKIVQSLPKDWEMLYFNDIWKSSIARAALYDVGQEIVTEIGGGSFTLEAVWEVVNHA